MCKKSVYLFLVFVFCLAQPLTAQLEDVTQPGDEIYDWPRDSSQTTVNFPYRAIDGDPANEEFLESMCSGSQ